MIPTDKLTWRCLFTFFLGQPFRIARGGWRDDIVLHDLIRRDASSARDLEPRAALPRGSRVATRRDAARPRDPAPASRLSARAPCAPAPRVARVVAETVLRLVYNAEQNRSSRDWCRSRDACCSARCKSMLSCNGRVPGARDRQVNRFIGIMRGTLHQSNGHENRGSILRASAHARSPHSRFLQDLPDDFFDKTEILKAWRFLMVAAEKRNQTTSSSSTCIRTNHGSSRFSRSR